MIYKNWMTHNLHKRLQNPNQNLELQLNPYKFSTLSFVEECDKTAQILSQKYKNIFIGLSGGKDSEFLCKIFHRNNIKFTPIITTFENNSEESFYAFEFCKNNNIKPTVLSLDRAQIIDIIYNNIVKKLNGIGFYAVGSIAAAKYAEKHGDVFIEGLHIWGDGGDLIENSEYYMSEWDFYNEILTSIDIIPFFLYRLELAAAMLKEIKTDFITWDNLKSHIFQCQMRKKTKPKYEENINKLNTILFLKNQKNNVANQYSFGNLQDLWKKLDHANIQ
jgi:hypothetical protein